MKGRGRRKDRRRELVIPPIVYSVGVWAIAALGALLTVLIFANADVLKAFFLPALLGYLFLLVLLLGLVLHRKYQRETMARYGLMKEELKTLENEYKKRKRR